MVQRSQAYCAPVFSIQEARIERLLQEAEKISAAASGQEVRTSQLQPDRACLLQRRPAVMQPRHHLH